MQLRTADNRTFAAHYEMIPIPCGVNESTPLGENWRFFVLCFPQLKPPSGSANLSMEDLQGGRSLSQLVGLHPLISQNARFEAQVRLWDGSTIDTQTRLVGTPNLELLAEILNGALSRSGNYFRTRGTDAGSVLVEDSSPTTKSSYVDVRRLYQRYCKSTPLSPHLSSALGGADQVPQSWSSMRKTMQRTATLAVREEANDRDLERYGWLLRPGANDSRLASHDLGVQLSAETVHSSPDDLVFAILQNFELALKVGLIVELEVSIGNTTSLDKEIRGVFTVTLGDGGASSADRFSAAFSRIYLDNSTFIVQPLSKYTDTPITLLTRHSTDDADPNYTFYGFSLDHSIVRHQFLPNKVSHDDDDPYGTSLQSQGVNLLAGHGVTFMGPVKDLIATQAPITQVCTIPSATLGHLFYFEDSWDGFRFDAASKLDISAAEFSPFLSIHQQRLEFCYETATSEQRRIPIEVGEDQIFRDQRTSFQKPSDVDAAVVNQLGAPTVHPAIFTWKGTGTVQSVPWTSEVNAKVYDSNHWIRGYVRDSLGRVEAVYPTLEYGWRYEFRFRNALQGGIGLSVKDADRIFSALKSNSSTHPEWVSSLITEYQHTRNQPLPAGVIVFEGPLPSNGDSTVPERLSITADRDSIDLWLFPAPIDREEVRYHGLLRRALREKSNIACVEGHLSDFLSQTGGARGGIIKYFADPDVTEVSITALILGNVDLDTRPNRIVDRVAKVGGAAIRSTEALPFVVGGTPLRLAFGKSDSFEFRPIRLRIQRTDSSMPKVSRGRGGDSELFVLELPAGDLARIEIVPYPSAVALHGLTVTHESSTRRVTKEDIGPKVAQILARTPGFTTPVHVEVVNEMSKMPGPLFERWVVRDGDVDSQNDAQAFREVDKTAINFMCAVHVDPRTVGTLSLQATWRNYIDDPRRPSPGVSYAPSVSTPERSVYFGPADRLDVEAPADAQAPARSAEADLWSEELYCIERSVLFGNSMPNGSRDMTGQVETGDLRHYRVNLVARARSRYFSRPSDPNSRSSITSAPLTLNIPSSLMPPPPQVAHVLALNSSSRSQSPQTEIQRFGRQVLRINLRRPWHVTGEGEMLAFVFDKNWRSLNTRNAFEIASPATAWGEDPLYRTYESETKDNISPGDLLGMLDGHQKAAHFDDGYPTLLETEIALDPFRAGVDPNAPASGETIDPRGAHLVCVRPVFDPQSGYWFVDLDPGDRNRFYRFELSRFQQFGLPGYQLSTERTFINIFSTRSVVLTTTKGADSFEITLDAIPYSGKALDASLPYLNNRYALSYLNDLTPKIYERERQDLVAPQTFKADLGNVRYVWKLPSTPRGIVAIHDMFRENVVAVIRLSDL